MRRIDQVFNQLTARNQIRLDSRKARFDQMNDGERTNFKEVLNSALHKVDTMQKTADQLVIDYSAGKVENIHDVMVAMEKANISLNTAVEVRNRLMDGYREIMNLRF